MATRVFEIHGSIADIPRRWSLAIVSEGFTQPELDAHQFEDVARDIGRHLLATVPFNAFADGIVIVGVEVPSLSSATVLGTTDAQRCNPVPSGYNTAFKARFCVNGVPRRLRGDAEALKQTVRAQPGLRWVGSFIALVNNKDMDGGSTQNGVGWMSLASELLKTSVHELGHSRFDLADEYDFAGSPTESPRSFGFPLSLVWSIKSKNATSSVDRDKIPWKDLITAHQIPTTAARNPCSHDHPVREEADRHAIGLFEGADHYACGVYRPEATCRMRDMDDPFCRVCDRHIRLDIAAMSLAPHRVLIRPIGAYTHVVGFTMVFHGAVGVDPDPRLVAYNSATGAVAIYRGRELAGNDLTVAPISPAGRTIAPLWSHVVPFERHNRPYVLFADFATQRQSIMRVTDDGRDVVEVWNGIPGDAFTHLVTFEHKHEAYSLAYNTLTGEVSIRRFEADGTAPAQGLAQTWEPHWSALTTMPLERSASDRSVDPYVLTYQWTSGRVQIRRIDPSDVAGTPHIAVVESFPGHQRTPPNLWSPNQTHVEVLSVRDERYLVRYSALDGWVSLHHPRTGGVGVDYLWGGYPPADGIPHPDAQFGPGALSIIGTAAPAFGAFPLARLSPTQNEKYRLWFYNASTARLNLYAFA